MADSGGGVGRTLGASGVRHWWQAVPGSDGLEPATSNASAILLSQCTRDAGSTPSMRLDEGAFWETVYLGEDSRLELKEVRFRGKRLDAPRPDAVADEIAAFANAAISAR